MICVVRTLKMINEIRVPQNLQHHLHLVMNDTLEVTLAVGAQRATPPPGSPLVPTGARRIARRK